MSDTNIIQAFSEFLGQAIVGVQYIETKFHYELSGEWTNTNTDRFVLHSPEWEVNLSNGQKWFLTNSESNMTVSNSTIAQAGDKIHTVPDAYGWSNALGQVIKAIRFYKRVAKTRSFLGFEISKTYEDNIQIIQFLGSNKTFSITAMNGDIGQMTFYPTGYLGESLGFVFDKMIADSSTVQGLTMTMEMIKEVRWQE